MQFSFFNSIRGKGRLCTREIFMDAVCNDALMPLYDNIAAADGEERQELKRRLPGVTWQAYFPEGRRSADAGVPNGAWMADLDHIGNPEEAWKELLSRRQELGILVAHMTPSREGLRLVLRRPEGQSIEQCQLLFKEALTALDGTKALADHLDLACKDLSRFSYLVPATYFFFIDEEVVFGEGEVWGGKPTPNPSLKGRELNPAEKSAANTAEGGLPLLQEGAGGEAFTPSLSGEGRGEAPGEASYKGRSIRSWAEAYVQRFGQPEPGTRHTYYYRMCANFKYITDCNQALLLAELPTFGLSRAEREAECRHACSRPTGGSIPKTFWEFLQGEGNLTQALPKREGAANSLIDLDDAPTAEEEFPSALLSSGETASAEAGGEAPALPIFASFARISPRDFVLPQVYAAEAALATLFTNLEARYLDGFYHTPTVHNVIYAPASCGKSFARRTIEMLTARLRRRDEETLALEQVYLEACRKAKNSKQQPDKPALPLRVISGIISQPKLLTRQQDANGLHQLCFVEEIDTLSKGNKGSAYNDKGDMYRNAWDNASYSQDYMSDSTFSGRVNLYLNVLATGTPEQVMKFYANPENGLISRLSICPIENQEFASIPVWGEFTQDELEEMDRVLDYADSITYYTRPDGSEHSLTRRDITDEMLFMYAPLQDWLEEKRLLALRTQDQALDHFRKREAVKMFRMAMVCYGCYCGQLDDARRQTIIDFCLWWGEHDLQNLIALYGEMVKDAQRKICKPRQDLLANIPDAFTASDVEAARLRANIKTPTAMILYQWKKAGLIEKHIDNYIKLKTATS